MPVSYVLRENFLTAEPNDYMAGVLSNQTFELEALVDRMIERGSTVTRADIFSVMEDLQGAVQSILGEGASVVTPFANFRSSIRGVFNGSGDACTTSIIFSLQRQLNFPLFSNRLMSR